MPNKAENQYCTVETGHEQREYIDGVIKVEIFSDIIWSNFDISNSFSSFIFYTTVYAFMLQFKDISSIVVLLYSFTIFLH